MHIKSSITLKRVFIVSGSYPPMEDGVSDYTHILFFALKQKLKSVFLVTTRTSISKEETERGVFGVVEKWSFRALLDIVKRIQKAKPAIVHFQYPDNAYGRRPAANFLPVVLRIVLPKIKIVSTIHEFSNRTLKGKLRLLISIAASHKIIIVNKEYERDIKRYWPFMNGRSIHIPVGSNISLPLESDKGEMCRLRNTLGIGENDPVISYFGIIRRGKGLELLLEAFHQVLQKRSNAKLLLVGQIRAEYYEQSLKKIIESRRLDSSVILTGACEHSEISQYLGLATMCVLPFEDGVSTKRTSFVTSLQHKLPTITTEGEFLPDGLINYKNVILVKYGDEKVLASKMTELIENEELRNNLRSNAQEVLKNYSWDSIIEKTVNVYRSLVG